MREIITSRSSGSRLIGPTLSRDRRRAHHPVVDQVEQDRLVAQLRDALLALRAHVDTRRRDRRSKQVHKDLQQRKNRAPETIGLLMTDAFNDRAPLSDLERIGGIISAFFRSHRRGEVRSIAALNPLETDVEGDMNSVQMAIAQGDHTTPMLMRLVDDIDRIAPLLVELKESALEEANASKGSRV